MNTFTKEAFLAAVAVCVLVAFSSPRAAEANKDVAKKEQERFCASWMS